MSSPTNPTPEKKTLTIERICSSPALCGRPARNLQLSPDGTVVTFLKNRSDDRHFHDLWCVRLSLSLDEGQSEPRLLIDGTRLDDCGGGEPSPEEKSRRERMRVAETTGLLDYSWSRDSSKLMIPSGTGGAFVYDVAKNEMMRLDPEGMTNFTDAKFTPEGNWVSYIKDGNVFLCGASSSASDNASRQVTFQGDLEKSIQCGVPEFVAQEEMSRMTGYWVSPDESYLAYTVTDESVVENVIRNEIYGDHVKTVEQRYPFVGKRNAIVELWVCRLSGDTRFKVDLGTDNVDIYLPRVKWASGSLLSFQVQTRDQKQLEFRFANVDAFFDGTVRGRKIPSDIVLLEENPDSYINLYQDSDLHFLENDYFIWPTEALCGFKQLALGRLERGESGRFKQIRVKDFVPLTFCDPKDGRWCVDGLKHVHAHRDEKGGVSIIDLYFLGNKDNVLEMHLFKVSFNVKENKIVFGGPHQLTEKSGMHSVKFPSGAENQPGLIFIHTFCSITQPFQTCIQRLSNEPHSKPDALFWVEENDPWSSEHPLNPYYDEEGFDGIQVDFGTLKTSDGTNVDLHYKIMTPKDHSSSKKYPALVYVYGGPHVQLVSRASSFRDSSLFLQYLVQKEKMVVFTLDNRGSSRRGLEFESSIYKQLSALEVSDQRTGIEYLRSLSCVDSERIAMYGHSYGGYMSLMCLFRFPPGYLNCAIAGAPVTDWRFYDTHYTERYNGVLSESKDASQNNDHYEKETNVLHYVPNYHDEENGRLLVIHGMADDNVLFKNSTSLYKKLQDEGKLFECLDYPGSKHGMSGGKVKLHMYRSISSFLKRNFRA